MSNDRLAAKVAAVNAANAYAKELYPQLAEVMRAFVGKKIIKQDGGLTAAVLAALPKLPCNGRINVYCQSYRTYSLSWVVKTNETICEDRGVEYHETSVNIGRVSDHILTEIVSGEHIDNLRTDYTVAEIEGKQKTYHELKNKADEARGELYPFGEY